MKSKFLDLYNTILMEGKSSVILEAIDINAEFEKAMKENLQTAPQQIPALGEVDPKILEAAKNTVVAAYKANNSMYDAYTQGQKTPPEAEKKGEAATTQKSDNGNTPTPGENGTPAGETKKEGETTAPAADKGSTETQTATPADTTKAESGTPTKTVGESRLLPLSHKFDMYYNLVTEDSSTPGNYVVVVNDDKSWQLIDRNNPDKQFSEKDYATIETWFLGRREEYTAKVSKRSQVGNVFKDINVLDIVKGMNLNYDNFKYGDAKLNDENIASLIENCNKNEFRTKVMTDAKKEKAVDKAVEQKLAIQYTKALAGLFLIGFKNAPTADKKAEAAKEALKIANVKEFTQFCKKLYEDNSYIKLVDEFAEACDLKRMFLGVVDNESDDMYFNTWMAVAANGELYGEWTFTGMGNGDIDNDPAKAALKSILKSQLPENKDAEYFRRDAKWNDEDFKNTCIHPDSITRFVSNKCLTIPVNDKGEWKASRESVLNAIHKANEIINKINAYMSSRAPGERLPADQRGGLWDDNGNMGAVPPK